MPMPLYRKAIQEENLLELLLIRHGHPIVSTISV